MPAISIVSGVLVCPLPGCVVHVFTWTGIRLTTGTVLAVRGTFERHHLLVRHGNAQERLKTWFRGERCVLAQLDEL